MTIIIYECGQRYSYWVDPEHLPEWIVRWFNVNKRGEEDNDT
jgi:hypothetical protein